MPCRNLRGKIAYVNLIKQKGEAMRSRFLLLCISLALSACANVHIAKGRYLQTGPKDDVISEIELDVADKGTYTDLNVCAEARVMLDRASQKISQCAETSAKLPFVTIAKNSYEGASITFSSKTEIFCKRFADNLRTKRNWSIASECKVRT